MVNVYNEVSSVNNNENETIVYTQLRTQKPCGLETEWEKETFSVNDNMSGFIIRIIQCTCNMFKCVKA